jgi:hypothetical protein
MFENNILIKGKYATYLKFLCDKTKNLGNDYAKNGAGIFKKFVDVLLVAPVFGVLKNKMADEDKSIDDSANILTEQTIKEQDNLTFIYRLVVLNDKSLNMSPDDKINFIFKAKDDKAAMKLFLSYARGGIEYLYEYFNDGASTKDDYYERVISLLDDAQLEATDNYDDMLKSLTGR